MALGGVDHPYAVSYAYAIRTTYVSYVYRDGTVPDKSIRDAYVPLPYAIRLAYVSYVNRMIVCSFNLHVYMFIYITCFVTKHQTCIKRSQAVTSVVR